MDVLSPLLQLLLRAVIIVLPLSTGWLALRRLLLSRSTNAWVYAVTCLFAAITVAGLMPWALGLDRVSWVFFLFAAFSPAIWVGVILLCDIHHGGAPYDAGTTPEDAPVFTTNQRPAPLILENPDWPGAPMPVFRHAGEKGGTRPASMPRRARQQEPAKSLMSVAREMRGNVNSEGRRPKLLPPPRNDFDLPFLKRG